MPACGQLAPGLKIGRHQRSNDYMFDRSILCFGQKMAEGRPLFWCIHVSHVTTMPHACIILNPTMKVEV